MGEVRVEGVSESLKKKKHKKRKHNEIRVLGGEDDMDVHLDDAAGHRKKSKIKESDGNGVLEAVVDIDVDVREDNMSRKEKKKKEKREKKERKAEKSGSGMNNEESSGLVTNDKERSGVINSEVGAVEVKRMKDKKEKKKKKKKSTSECKSNDTDDTSENMDRLVAVESAGFVGDRINIGTAEEVKSGKDNKRRKKKKGDIGAGFADEELINGTHVASVSDKEGSQDGSSKKRKKKSRAVNTEESDGTGVSVNTESTVGKKSRKVKFDDTVQVFSLPENSSEEEENLKGGGDSSKGKDKLEGGSAKKNMVDGLVQGKRFSKEEDEIIRKAVLDYIEDHQLGEEGVNMVMKCKHHKELRECWKEIAEALPWRQRNAVYSRAHILFERSESRTWSKEELEEVRKYHEKYGPKWRELADEIGRNRIHVKDAYRQVKLANKKVGQWSQEEYQTLFNLVNKDLRIRAFMERKSKHGMLRDNIGWEAISEQLTTRTDPVCCQKWYNQLTSALVACGKWADADDFRLLMALEDLDATCEEDVDWDYVLEHRPGDVCRRRWNEMVRHIGEHGTKSFSEQVEILSQRYCPDVLEAREIYDNKPFAD